jgi:uncharacterized membrane protein (DUF485 family)
MAQQPPSSGDGPTGQPPPGSERDEPLDRTSIDWEAAENSPEFKELIKKRRSFVIPATIFFFVWYFGFILLAGYAPDFMAESVYEGLTVGYLLALSQFVMTWVLAGWYVRKARKDFDPLAKKAADTAVAAGRRGRPTQQGGVVSS